MEELILGWPKELLGHCRPLMGKINLGVAPMEDSIILGMAQDPQRRNAILPPAIGLGVAPSRLGVPSRPEGGEEEGGDYLYINSP